MPNSIEFAKKYTGILDEVYQRAVVSNCLNSSANMVRAGRNAKENFCCICGLLFSDRLSTCDFMKYFGFVNNRLFALMSLSGAKHRGSVRGNRLALRSDGYT